MFVRLLTGLSLFALLLSTPARGQAAVLVVDFSGGGDFDEIQPAVDAASSGDTLLLKTGFYESFVIDGKSLSLVADVGATAVVAFGPTALATVRNLGVDQSVVLRGFAISPSFGSPSVHFLLVEDNLGPVWIEDVAMPVSSFAQGVTDESTVVRNSASVTILRSSIRGGQNEEALLCEDSAVYAYDSTLRGGDGGAAVFALSNGPGGAGCRVDGGFLFASGCLFAGGAGGDSSLFAVDCSPPGDGGHGLSAVNGASLVTVHSVATGGAGGQSVVCAGGTGAPGAPIVTASGGTHVEQLGTARSVVAASPVRDDETLTLTYGGVVGELVFVGLGLEPVPGVFLPPFTGALLIPADSLVAFQGNVGATGTLEVSVPLADLGPGVEVVSLYFQPVFVDTGTGSATLGAPTALTILGQPFP